MIISIEPRAHQWFIEEVGLENGDFLRFTGKVYGNTNVHEGFSVAINATKPNEIIGSTEIDGITYYADAEDAWFFADYDFEVHFDEELGEASYKFTNGPEPDAVASASKQ